MKDIQLHELSTEVQLQAKRIRPNDSIIYAYLDDDMTLILEFDKASDPYRFLNGQLVRWRHQ